MMDEQGVPASALQPFSTHREFEAFFRECIVRSRTSLQLFDPDFSVFPLGASDIDAALRHFVAGGGHLQLAMHRSNYIQQHYPRFLKLLKDFSHRIECKVTGKGIAHLTDSFCIGDAVHIVRRFHSDHLRGEAAFLHPAATETPLDRFEQIWAESTPGLHPTTTGL
jgi:hypothetical protein